MYAFFIYSNKQIWRVEYTFVYYTRGWEERLLACLTLIYSWLTYIVSRYTSIYSWLAYSVEIQGRIPYYAQVLHAPLIQQEVLLHRQSVTYIKSAGIHFFRPFQTG